MGEPFMGLNEALIDQNLIDEFEQSLENQETPASSLPMIPVTTSELNSLIADTADENGSSGQLVRNSKKKRDSDGIVLVDDRGMVYYKFVGALIDLKIFFVVAPDKK